MNLIKKNKEKLRLILAVCIFVAGVAHFVVADPFIKIVPPALPHARFLVYYSGVIEIFLAIALLIPSWSRPAAWGLVGLFIAVYPANINMAVNHIKLAGIPSNNWFQAIRLPFQAVLIAWAWWYTFPNQTDQASIFKLFKSS